MTRVEFDFFAQTANVDVDGARGDERSFFPDGVEELVAGEDTPAMGGEVLEQAELAHRGEDIAALHLHRHGRSVDFEVAKAENLKFFWRLPRAAQHAPHTGNQFTRAEGLGDVVVTAEFEALNPVGLGGFRGEEDYRDGG